MSFRSTSLFFASLLISAAALGSGFTTTPFPTPLTANAPSGSLIYSGSTTGSIAFSGDGHNFTLPLDAGQTITADVVPGATLQPAVDLRDPAFNLIGTATAAGAGQ